MNLFIDANIFLSFYEFTSENIGEIKKLVLLIEKEEIALLLPQQVADEVRRRRAGTISDSFRRFSQSQVSLLFPSYFKGHRDYNVIRSCLSELVELHSRAVEDIRQDIDNKKLPADLLLKDLFSRAIRINNTLELIECARQRVELGNPPGKKNSTGDAVR